ncbi:MAG TPA: IS110 family transposase [bacterium]|nr:IS110 family transposase [bacterium]
MEVVYPRCCGLDVHKKNVTACLLTVGADGTRQKEIRTFETMTDDLLTLADWLVTAGCTHVAMESTGVYWKPIYNLLDGAVELLVVNAQHIKAVPGRKSDVRDAEWIADLLQHGLVRGSYIPDRPQRELREVTRYRTALVREQTREFNRLQKVLEGANIKLASVASTMTGHSVRAMLEALVAGTTDPAALADLAQGKLRKKRPELERALAGRLGAHQRFMLAEQLAHLEYLEEAITHLNEELKVRLRPFEAELQWLDTIPGVARVTAEIALAELGVDMTRFPTDRHCASWSGLCPGQDESAGKRRSGKTRHGSQALRAALVQAAHGAARAKDTYLSAQYHRLAARRGKKRAAVAVAHTIITIIYHLLRTGGTYRELGGNFFDERDREQVARRQVARLQRLGYRVTLERVPA